MVIIWRDLYLQVERGKKRKSSTYFTDNSAVFCAREGKWITIWLKEELLGQSCFKTSTKPTKGLYVYISDYRKCMTCHTSGNGNSEVQQGWVITPLNPTPTSQIKGLVPGQSLYIIALSVINDVTWSMDLESAKKNRGLLLRFMWNKKTKKLWAENVKPTGNECDFCLGEKIIGSGKMWLDCVPLEITQDWTFSIWSLE